jgi:hypothetical protein
MPNQGMHVTVRCAPPLMLGVEQTNSEGRARSPVPFSHRQRQNCHARRRRGRDERK